MGRCGEWDLGYLTSQIPHPIFHLLSSRPSGSLSFSPQKISSSEGKEAPCEAHVGKDIAVADVEGFRSPHENLAGDGRTGEDLGLCNDFSCGGDDPADARIGGPCNKGSVFNGSEGCHGEMLERCRCFPKPGIIRNGYQKVRTVSDECAVELGEYDLIADQNAESAPREGEDESPYGLIA